MGRERAEDPLGKAVFFTKLAEAVPMESAVAGRSELVILDLFGFSVGFYPFIPDSLFYIQFPSSISLI
ncbi:hypothetical protein [Salibacterium halotolerans]|nr:hypothetical protein [Salibacterium halotolerans]